MRSPTSRMACARSGNRRAKQSPSLRTSLGVRSRWLNGDGGLSRKDCNCARGVDFRRLVSLRPNSARHFTSMLCRPIVSNRKSLSSAIQCFRQRSIRRRAHGLSEIASTNQFTPRPTTVAATQFGSCKADPRKYPSTEFNSPQERRKILLATSLICHSFGMIASFSTSS